MAERGTYHDKQCNSTNGEKSWLVGSEKAQIEENNFPAINRVSLQDVARERFADLVRVAFPGRSDAQIARRAAKVLKVSDKQVKNWLNCESSPSFDIVFAIGCLVGVFRVMDVMTRGQSRWRVLGMIVQKGARRVFGK